MILLYILIAALALFVVSVTIIVMLIGPILLLNPRRRGVAFYRNLGLQSTPEEAGVVCEDISITVESGLKLRCWLAKTTRDVQGTIVYLHGVGDCRIDGLRLARLLTDNGYNVFLYDSRRHGESDGTYCTYGFHEKNDVSAILNYLATRTDFTKGKFGLFGTSMGAAVALQAAAIDDRVAAVVAENSFATLRTIFDDYQKRMIRVPFHYLRNLVIMRSERTAHFKARDVSPLRAVSSIHVPLLFIYGTDDHLIDHRYSLSLFQYANEPKRLFAIQGARHNDTWKVAGDAYARTILEFYAGALK